MPALAVEISRFIDEHQPGFVECALVDAHGFRHLFHEKSPVVSEENLLSTSQYPRPGVIACEVQEQWQDAEGRSLVQVTTERPFGVESTSGQSRFVVLSSQLQP
jgi:hypothetical protein